MMLKRYCVSETWHLTSYFLQKNIYCDSYRSEIHKLTDVMSLGPRLWNSLPSEIKAAKYVNKFKNAIVNHMLNSVCL